MALDYASVAALLDAHADEMRSRSEPPPAEEMPLTVYDDEPMAGKTAHQGSERARTRERLRDNRRSPDWPQPRPIAHELRPVPPFQPETLLPEVLRAWVMDEAERMPCPPDYVAAAALVALDHELTVAVIILSDIVAHRRISETELSRLMQAAARIGAARDLISPAEAHHGS